MGISSRTQLADLCNAVMEGVALALRHASPLSEHSGAEPLMMVGGGAGSLTWPQRVADVLRQPISVPEHPNLAGAVGAAQITGKAFGWTPTRLAASRIFQPNLSHGEVYDALYHQVYKDLAHTLQPVFSGLARFS